MRQKGITLIGMPASGKSTIGRELSNILDLPLLDVDRWIEELEGGMPLSQIIETKGADYTLDLETKSIRNRDLHETIVSTPGSIIYNDVLDVLQEQAHIIWLNVPFDTLRGRLDADSERTRLVIGLEEKGLDTLFNERVVLYKKWAQYTVDCQGKSTTDITSEIINVIGYDTLTKIQKGI